jgi:hypothetical protein
MGVYCTALCIVLTICAPPSRCQTPANSPASANPPPQHAPTAAPQPDKNEPALNVNWIYGAYVPTDAPLEPLNGKQRFKLYLRQSYTTPGIYVKTTIFVIKDQALNDPEEWGGGVEGFAKRFGSRQGQFVIQNSLSAFGDAITGLEPRYDRCRNCDGFKARTTHALIRNFVTYNRTEKEFRPRVPLYIAAFGAGAIASTWKPANPDVVTAGLNGMLSQVIWGAVGNFVGEFAPDALRYIKEKRAKKAHPTVPDATSRD